MKITRIFMGALAILLCLPALSACSEGAAPTTYPEYRYRLKVEVETPEGLRTGSSVIEVKTYAMSRYSIPDQGKIYFRVNGEAVAVDLPNGKTLFALLRSESSVDWAGSIMRGIAPDIRHKEGADNFGRRHQFMLQRTGEYELGEIFKTVLGESSSYPMLVTFNDIDDPASVKLVDPDALPDSFGQGYRLKRITVQLTNAPVTTGIEKRLPWLPDYYNQQFSGDRYQALKNKDKGVSAFITAGPFSMGNGLSPYEREE